MIYDFIIRPPSNLNVTEVPINGAHGQPAGSLSLNSDDYKGSKTLWGVISFIIVKTLVNLVSETIYKKEINSFNLLDIWNFYKKYVWNFQDIYNYEYNFIDSMKSYNIITLIYIDLNLEDLNYLNNNFQYYNFFALATNYINNKTNIYNITK